MSKVLIVGGGPAGMIAAIAAAREGASATIFEKNEKLGKKLFITGKGRCNVTNACEREALFKNVNSNPRFLYSAFEGFDNVSVMDFFEDLGLKLKIERGQRVFPESDKSSDVIKALKDEIERLGISVLLNTEISDINVSEEGASVSYTERNGRKVTIKGDSVIIATGGVSYKSTGSTGDGYRFAKAFGHEITNIVPSLVPVETNEEFPTKLQGLSLKNVKLSLINEKGKTLYSDIGEMLFTHFGVSGPLVLSASAYIADAIAKGKEIPYMLLDMKPGMSADELDNRLLKDFSAELNKNFANSLDQLLPQSMIPVIVELSGIDPYKKVNSITKEERNELVQLLKNLKMTVSGLRNIDEAIITKGGINVKQVNPTTMGSKLCNRLYFAGEVLDLDAMTGGFNLQIAWSTGYAAGKSAAWEGKI